MNAPTIATSLRPAWSLPRFIVFEVEYPEDGSVCRSEDDVWLALDGLRKRKIFDGYRVWAISLNDAPGRDVTADFPSEKDADDYPEYSPRYCSYQTAREAL